MPWSLHDAKNRLSQLVREAQDAPQVIAVRGEERAVVLSPEAYRRLTRPGVRSGRSRVTAPRPEFLLGQLSGAARWLLAMPGGVQHFQEARLLFETALARHAAERASDADLAALESALENNRAALGDLAEFERTDVAFHFEIAALPGNPIFTAMHQASVEWLTHQRAISLKVPGADRKAYECHRRIFEAIGAHDPDRAEREMRDHLGQVAELYWRVAEGDGRA